MWDEPEFELAGRVRNSIPTGITRRGSIGGVVLAGRDAIVLQPSAPVTVKNVNDSLLVTCSSKGNLMMWLKRGGTEVSAKKGRVHVESKTKDGNSSIYLMFESINKKDEGNYTCKANVDGKEVSASFNLVVISELLL
ncbi:unnamed protein product [Timema podura]|uniref:Ig-like domain-containing protein n=1 Tax=Timema podura TaxID=61482 RepID=A0ABN7P3A1_TIMPD|nr:unnamed protein product [Timema podura]